MLLSWTLPSCTSEIMSTTILVSKLLEKSYLLRVHGKIVERPQHMLLRVSCGIHSGDVKAAIQTYDLMLKLGDAFGLERIIQDGLGDQAAHGARHVSCS